MAGVSGAEICWRRTDIVDDAVEALFEPFKDSGVALAALGGYGRQEVTRGSDVDLLFVHEGLADEKVGAVADAVLYPLWDSGVSVSHAVRTPTECRKQAEARVESLTTVLNIRHLVGPEELVASAVNAVVDVARGDLPAFVRRLVAWRDDRRRRFGHVGRMLEPDLKESVGGLRDIPVVGWCLIVAGDHFIEGPDPRGLGALIGALDRLLSIRNALHRVTGSSSTRLLVEHQQAVADELGIAGEPSWDGRDVLMRTVFTFGRWVDLAVENALQLRESSLRPLFGIGEILPSWFGPVTAEARSDARDDPPLLAMLMETLSGDEGLRLLYSLDSRAKLDRFLPAWASVRCRPQRDPYHQYPVDIHLLETTGEVTRLLRERSDPFAVQAVGLVEDPVPLLLGALLHDIGKVGRGSHVTEGVKIANRALDDLEVDTSVRDDVLFLVREHLLLADTATRRNLEDEDLILDVAAKIRDPRRLALLYLLTVADAVATGPHASSAWRMNLVRDLVSKVSHVFERGIMDPDRAGLLASARSAVSKALAEAQIPHERIESFVDGIPPGYLLWVQPGRASDHVRIVLPPPDPTEVRVNVVAGGSPGAHEVSIGAVDRLGLLALVAGSFTLSGLSIFSAQAFTTSEGVALDVFEVRGAFEEDVDPHRWARFEDTLRQAIEGEFDLESAVRTLRTHYRRNAADTPISVKIDQEASDFFTVIEVAAPDRMGLLFDLAKTLSEHGLDVHVAKVATYGPRVVDVFYVRDEEGQKVERSEQLQRLVDALTEAASN